MPIAKEVDFVSGVTPVSEAWLDLLQEFLAAYISPNFIIEESSPTQIRVPAGNDHDSVAVAISGHMRRRDTNATATVSGGAGTKNIYATADSGDDLFALEVVAGASAATEFRKVGEVDWSGTVITDIRLEQPAIVKVLAAVVSSLASETTPIGAMMMWPYGSAPAGFLLLQGQAVSRGTYPVLNSLASADGYPHGAGDGSTTFNLPDVRRRMPIGKADSGTVSVLGETGGSWDHTHTNPSTGSAGGHSHSQGSTGSDGSHAHSNPNISGGSHDHGGSTGGAVKFTNPGGHIFGGNEEEHVHSISSSGSTHTHAQGNTGSGGTHSHTNPATSSTGAHTHPQGSTGSANPPYIVVNFIIRAG